jgi:hypothetical protein
MVKIYAWYDNEIGYSMRTAELARMVANKFIVGLTMASPASLAAGAGAPASCTAS